MVRFLALPVLLLLGSTLPALAEAPSDTVLNEIKAALRDVAKADVSVDVKIDPSLIGGLIVKMGSRMVDASVRTKLNSIRLAMKEVH